MDKTREKIQEEQYNFPYHHLASFNQFDNHKVFYGGLSYYGYISKVFAYVNKEKFSSLLDFGCGDGKLIFELVRTMPDKKLTGIDYSERAILFAKAFNYSNGSEFICGDINKLQGQYDVITAVEVLEHISDEDTGGIIKSLHRLLSLNGILVVSVPSTNDPLNQKHYRHYTLPLLIDCLKEFKMENYSFIISNNKFYVFLTKLSGKLSNFKLVRYALLKISEKLFFEATEKTGTHIVAVFRKI